MRRKGSRRDVAAAGRDGRDGWPALIELALFEALGRAGFKSKVGIVDVSDMEK